MGLTRKMLSVGTLGAIDLRSDKERIARNTKRTYKEIKAQGVTAETEAKAERKARQAEKLDSLSARVQASAERMKASTARKQEARRNRA